VQVNCLHQWDRQLLQLVLHRVLGCQVMMRLLQLEMLPLGQWC
jgi:hypothetical protein